MRRYVLEVSDEEQCRFFQTRIHNLQSKYDTFVKATEAEQRDPDLKRFRGYVSITLHLIECMTQLVHFYERHENDIRGEQVKNRIAALIDKDEVLDRALNFCLYFTHAYLNERDCRSRRASCSVTRARSGSSSNCRRACTSTFVRRR